MIASKSELVKYETDPIDNSESLLATITLDSVRNRNALSGQLLAEIRHYLGVAENDDLVRVILIRANGPSFSSGTDLSEALGGGMEEGSESLVAIQRRLASLNKPVVAAVHGSVRAGGIGIVAACDIAISTDTCTYAFTEVRLGLAPAAISLSVLPRVTDRAAALCLLGGGTFDGIMAQDIGLVTLTVTEGEFDLAVADVISSLALATPQGLRETKKLLAQPLVDRIDEYGDTAATLSSRLFASPEAREAMQRFVSHSSATLSSPLSSSRSEA